jgi:1-phosphofructokinase
MLLHEMETLHIKHSFISIHEETRTNLKIVDQSTKETTEVNEAGGEVQASELKAFYELFDQLLQDAAVLVLAGSLSPGLSIDIYEQLLQMAHGQGVLSILDAEGESFLHGLKAHPTVIKPNIHELEGLLNRQLHHDSEIVNACHELIDTYKLDAVIVSMGKDGSIFVNKSETLRVTPFPIEPKSTVGAGDSMVAAIASSLVHQRSFKDMARYACAAGTITASKSGTVQEVEQKLDQVGITRLS